MNKIRLIKALLNNCACLALATIFAAGSVVAQTTEEHLLTSDSAVSKMMLLGAAVAGDKIFVVGERGALALSSDGGKSFQRVGNIPSRYTLTSISFINEKHGWVAGHGGVIFSTNDGGTTWKKQREELGEVDRPIFSVHFTDEKHGVAVGLWSLVLVTDDGGVTWKDLKLPPPPDGSKADRNLLSAFSDRQGRLFVAAERGMILRSEDHGHTWVYLNTKYAGSFWTGTALHDGSLLVAGLRGTIYRSADHGDSWEASPTQTKSSITAIAEFGTRVLAVGLDGLMLSSSDGGRSFVSKQREDRLSFTALIQRGGLPLALSKSGVLANPEGLF